MKYDVVEVDIKTIDLGDNTEKGVKYIEDGQRITAVLAHCKFDVVRRIMKMFSNNPDAQYINIFGNKKLMLKDYYIGRATCREGDVFDLEVGKKLAKTRMMKQYNRDLERAIKAFKTDVDTMNAAMGSLEQMLDKRMKRQEIRFKDLKDLGIEL